MIVLGITGGVGSGKSRVLSDLKETHNAYVLEADKLAHSLMQPGESIYHAVTELFGRNILKTVPPYEIDRAKLGDMVFHDREKLQTLNAVSHPLVKENILQQIKDARARGSIALFVIEAALLLEDGYKEICDEIWYIRASRKTRIRRLMKQRGYTQEKCISMMDNQSPDSYYMENADFIIDNETNYELSAKQINARLNILL